MHVTLKIAIAYNLGKYLEKFAISCYLRTATQRFVYTKRDVIFCDGIYLIVVNIVPIIIDA